jgi:hypothetical protein
MNGSALSEEGSFVQHHLVILQAVFEDIAPARRTQRRQARVDADYYQCKAS